MCKTYNTIGSLTTIKSQLQNHNIHGFKSLRDILNFQSSYASLKQELISQHKTLIEQEKDMLTAELQLLEKEIESQRQHSEKRLTDELTKLKQQLDRLMADVPKNLFQWLRKWLTHQDVKRTIKHREARFEKEVNRSICNLIGIYEHKSNRHRFLSSQLDEAIRQSVQHHLFELERKKSIIDDLNRFIYGALGEHKVAKTLECLPDNYYLINDFAISFVPAIYNKRENDYIKSVQIDHVLVGPSGIFLIETKNWSENSLRNPSLRSPVLQIKRASYVLFRLTNNELSNNHLRLNRHHWGEKKIPIRNLVVLTQMKPKEEFQHVKVLTVNELLNYVNYFKPSLSDSETQAIADFLVHLNNQKTIATRRH